jgi:RNA polymerase sigma-70 factor (ECF subfamily)
MADDDELTRRFDALRPDLVRVAYGTLGSVADAEDVVQEAWVRAQRADREEIRDLRAWLTTVVARLALDALRSARARREAYIGPWLPEPVVEELDPADRVTLDETIGMALMVVLERLSPAERAAFVLHDVFGLPFEEVAAVVGRTPAAVRQLASRARRRVEDERPRFTPSADEQLAVVGAFAAACQAGDLDGLLRVLDPDVVWRSDGGGRVQAARKPVQGALRVAKAMLALARGVVSARPALVNGAPGIVVTGSDGVLTVEAFTIVDGRITALHFVRNPDKLRHVDA